MQVRVRIQIHQPQPTQPELASRIVVSGAAGIATECASMQPALIPQNEKLAPIGTGSA
jgi:hypothetical protein